MTSHQEIISLTLSPAIQETGILKSFVVSKSKQSNNLIIELNGKYDGKKVVSTVNVKNWRKTQVALSEALETKSVSQTHITLILDELDNNNELIISPFTVNGNGSDTDNSSPDQGTKETYREISLADICKDYRTARRLNKDITMGQWLDGLNHRYQALKKAMERNFPNGWSGLELSLAVLRILNIDDITLPFACIILSRSGSKKTLSMGMLIPWLYAYYTRKFNPRAFVTHNTAVESEEQLRKIDLLPRIRHKILLTPELAPMFSANEDELRETIGTITSILDGKGYVSDSGAHGQRGYNGDYYFTWVGATVDIPYRVYKLSSHLGPKIYYFRLPYFESKDSEILDSLSERFEDKRLEVQKMLMEYLIWFELCPDYISRFESVDDYDKMEVPREGIRLTWNSDKDDSDAKALIIKLARLLGKLRAHVEIWSQKQPGGHEYTEYGYAIPNIEDPDRCAKCLYYLTRGKALIIGRTHIKQEDLDLAVKVTLSSGTQERIAVLDLLCTSENETLTMAEISDAFTMSTSTALRTMTELKAVKIVDLEDTEVSGNKTQQIRLRKEFDWLNGEDFKRLRGDYTPIDRSKYNEQRGIKEAGRLKAFWSKFEELESESSQGFVNIDRLAQFILGRSETCQYFAGKIDVEIFIKKMAEAGYIERVNPNSANGIDDYKTYKRSEER